MTYKARKRLAILVLVVGLPLYVLAAVAVVGLFDRPPILAELAIYVGGSNLTAKGNINSLKVRRVGEGGGV